jgi:protocatechuate 3,4-dioxygenase beta subunit
MSRRTIFVVVAVACAIAVWAIAGAPGARSVASAPPRPVAPAAEVATAAQAPVLPAAHPRTHPRPGGTVEISGTVVDRGDGSPVGGVEVVVRGPLGEASVSAAADGAFALDVSPGAYHLFVRGDDIMTVGLQDPVRLDLGPRPELAGMPDESLMPLVIALHDTTVDLPVVHGGAIEGKVVDASGAAIAHALVRAKTDLLRPALGTDIAETDDNGAFTLRVPPGTYSIEASHSAFAGAHDPVSINVEPGAHPQISLMMSKGCIIKGRVVTADGKPANEGALERQRPGRAFGPTGSINADGTFRWATQEMGEVTIRAWPWKSMPSEARTFACSEGKVVNDVVFHVPDGKPSLDGSVIDGNGDPIPFAYIDVQPLDDVTMPWQQERADAAGHWHVYEMPPGRYEVIATAAGRGITHQTVVSPHADVQIRLTGTGRIEGTTTDLATGSFEAWFDGCVVRQAAGGGPAPTVEIAHEPRIVQVRGGRFTIDNAPACALTMEIRWHGVIERKDLVVDVDRPAHLDLDLGSPRGKTVHGVVRDGNGQPVGDAHVTATSSAAHATSTARTDSTGAFAITTYSGAQLVAGDGEHVATADIGHANVADEQVELVVR